MPRSELLTPGPTQGPDLADIKGNAIEISLTKYEKDEVVTKI